MYRKSVFYLPRFLFLAGVLILFLSSCQSSPSLDEESSPDESLIEETSEGHSAPSLEQGAVNPEIVLPEEPEVYAVDSAVEGRGNVEEKILSEDTLSEELLQGEPHKAVRKEHPVKGPLKNEIETMDTELLSETDELPVSEKEAPVETEKVPEVEDVPVVGGKSPMDDEPISVVAETPVEEVTIEEESSEVEEILSIEDGVSPVEEEVSPEESSVSGRSSLQDLTLPSEFVDIPVNPLLVKPERIDSDPVEMPSTEPEVPDGLAAGRDKYEILELEGKSPAEPAEESSLLPEEILMDEEEYSVVLDHLERLVVSLDGSGWIFLSVLSPDSSTLYLSDKNYDPAEGCTNFIFKLKGEPGTLELSMLKQDLFSGEDQRYIVVVEEGLLSGRKDETERTDRAVQGDLPEKNENVSGLDNNAVEEEAEVPEAGPSVSSESAEALQDDPSGVYEPFPDVRSLNAQELLALAHKYEQPGPGQSLEQAREYYLLILDKYPVSLERFKAEERLRYLDRHYFKVQ